ncbi:acyl-CoA dehydrogenase family protein [Devosia sp. A449]
MPAEFGGRAQSYLQLAHIEEALSANGLGPIAVEISGQLTIGAGALLGFGTDMQRGKFLPEIAKGRLIAFALTEVGTGVNAKKIQAYVETDANGNYRLFADGSRNKLWITSACHGGLVAVAARIGKTGTELGLFITELPEQDVAAGEKDWEFRCEPSGVDAFTANVNSRLHFSNYPIPAENRIPGDGVEVLFYSLRLGRCMLAAMSAGYQRMLARDASHYAGERRGVGGPVIKHELPQLAIGRMLGGSLQARALAYLALSQDAAGANLAGLRDITKSAAADTGNESMRASEHVMGGRAFDRNSRVNKARANLHLFGIVEGENDMIRMGMVRDVTASFVDRYLAPLLGALQKANIDQNGRPVAADRRMLRLGGLDLVRSPRRSVGVLANVVTTPAVYRLLGWIVANAADDLKKMLSSKGHSTLPKELRGHARYAEAELRKVRWRYLRLTLSFQLELASAQLALQRLGLQIEHLVSMVAICHHAAVQDPSQWRIAHLRCLLLREQVEALTAGLRTRTLRRLRRATAEVAQDVVIGSTSLFHGLDAEPYAHPFGKAE